MPNGDVIDSLQIQLTADVSKATRSIGILIKRFEKLESVCVGMNTGAMSQNFSRVNSSLNSLSSSTKKFGNALDGVKKKLSVLSMKSFSASVTKLNTSLPALGRSAKSAGEGIGSFTTSFTSAIIRARAFIAVVKRLWNAFSDGIKLASDLTEVQNVVDKAFGNEASKLEELVQTSIQQLGMSELTAKQIASRYQSMGKAMGISGGAVKKASEQIGQLREGYNSAAESMADVSLNLTRLSADMASFYNVDIDSVAEDLNAVFTGQTRPLRQYGLDLTQATLQEWALKNGIDADVKSMTQAEKTLLRYQYVMAQTKLVQGDFADTADTWANRVKVLKQQFEALGAVIGGGLINALKPFVAAMNTALTGIISFAKTVVNALGKIFGWEYEITSGGSVMDESMIDALEDQSSGLDDVADSAGGAAGKLNEAKTAAEEYKNTVLGFDELNKLNAPTESSGGSGSPSGGSGTGKTGKASALPTGGAVNVGDVQVAFKRTKALYESEIDTLYDLGRYISDTLTKALNDIDWEGVYDSARNFGRGLAEFLNGLITPDLFSALGRTIANSLNAVVYQVASFAFAFDFKNFGTSLGAGLNSALLGFDTVSLAYAITAFGNGLWDAVDRFVATLDWGGIGTHITDGINTFIREFDWEKRISTLLKFALGLLTALQNMFININWGLLMDNIIDAFEKVDFSEVGVEIINTIWTAIMQDKLTSDEYDAVKGAFKDLEDIFRDISDFTFTGLRSLYKNVLEPLATWTVGKGLPNLSTILKNINDRIDWDKVSTALDDLLYVAGQFGEGVADGFIGFFEDLSELLGPVLGFTINLVSDAIIKLVDGIKGANGDTIKKIGEGVGKVLSAVTTYIVTKTMYDGINGLGTHLPGLLDAIVKHPARTIVVAGLAVGAALYEIYTNAKNMKSEYATNIHNAATAVDDLAEKLNAVDVDSNVEGSELQRILDEFWSLNSRLLSGDDLTESEKTMLDNYRQVLIDKVPGIAEEIGKIGEAYTGSKAKLEELIQKQIDQSKITSYLSIIDEAIKKQSELTVNKDLLNDTYRENMVDAAKRQLQEYGWYLDTLDPTGASSAALQYNDRYMEIYEGLQNGRYVDAGGYYYNTENPREQGFLTDEYRRFEEALNSGFQYSDDLKTASWYIRDHATAVSEADEAWQGYQDTIDAATDQIKKIQDGTSNATKTVTRHAGSIETAVGASAKRTVHAINEAGDVVENDRPWKAAYKNVKKSTDDINATVDDSTSKLEAEIEETGKNVNADVETGLDNVDKKIVEKTPQVESDATLYGSAAGGGLGRGFYRVLQQNIAPNLDLTEQLVSGVKSKITNGFEIQGGTSRYAEKAGQSIPAGLKTGTEEGTPSLLNKFIALPGRIKQSMGDLFGFMKPSGVSMISGIGSGAESQSPWAITKIVGIRNSLIGAFGGLSGSMWGVGRDAISHLIGGITSMHVPIPHIQSAGSVLQAIGGVGMAMPQYQVAWYANGGLATSSSIVGVGEAGHEGILPLTNASAMQEIAGAIVSGMIDSGAIADAVTRGMVAAGQNNDRPVIVNATLRTENDEVLARAVTRGQRKINYRTSPVAP